MKRGYLIFVLLLVPAFALAQVSASGLSHAQGLGKTVYGLGFSAGWASGVGISFRAHAPSNSSYEAVFGIIKTSEKLSLSLGAEYQYDLVRGPLSRFFACTAMSYVYYGHHSNEVKGPFRLGVGVGGEFKLQDALHCNLQGLFVFFSDGRVIPLPQIGLHYYFN